MVRSASAPIRLLISAGRKASATLPGNASRRPEGPWHSEHAGRVRSISQVFEHNPALSRFELHIDGELAGWVDSRPAGASVIIAHTEVAEGHEGEGLGSTLVRETLGHLRERGKTVIPTCPFAAAYIQRHPEYIDLVDPSMRGHFTSPG